MEGMPTPTDRDHGLRKLSQATRWIAAGGVALTGLLSGVAAHAFSGHSTTATVSNGSGSATDPAAGSGTSGEDTAGSGYGGGDDAGSYYTPPSYSRGGFQAPAYAPQVTGRAGRATSGGS